MSEWAFFCFTPVVIKVLLLRLLHVGQTSENLPGFHGGFNSSNCGETTGERERESSDSSPQFVSQAVCGAVKSGESQVLLQFRP